MDDTYSRLADAVSAWIASEVRTAGLDGVVLGLSGGVDSAVAAALCARTLGEESTLCLYMPIESRLQDREDAILTADTIGVDLVEIPLDGAYREMLAACLLQPDDVMARANIKPRLRMTALYAHSGGRLVVGTGNYSEYLVGYSTKWGDGAADIMPLARLYKDEVLKLAAELGIPRRIIEKPPSAGLWEGQTDEGEMRVSYYEIRTFHEGGTVSAQASERIRDLMGWSEHKRRPIPFFDARGWFARNG